MFTYEWLKGCDIAHITGKKLIPPYSTDNFYYNFDDSEFADDE